MTLAAWRDMTGSLLVRQHGIPELMNNALAPHGTTSLSRCAEWILQGSLWQSSESAIRSATGTTFATPLRSSTALL